MKLALCALPCCLLFYIYSFGCTLGIQPITRFDPTEYVFTGQVVGIVGPFESKKFRGRAWGLRIKVEEKVYLPEAPATYFEVFPFELWADCSTAGTSNEELTKHYPLGSKVKVVAKEAQLLPRKLQGGNIRLEIPPGKSGGISRNYYEDGGQMTDARSVFDYKSFKKPMPADYVAPFMPFLDAHGALPEFELRKDLLRLETVKAQGERVRILERLLYYPACCGGGDYYGIAKHYLRSQKLVSALNAKREAWINKERE